MITFLPYYSFEETAKCLDYRRLGKQRVEAKQVLNILKKPDSKLWNHPLVKMWSGFDEALSQYLRAMIVEWVRRGYWNTMTTPEKLMAYELPFWFLNHRVRDSHRGNLLRKDMGYYSQFGWDVKPSDTYFWPR